MMVEKLNKDTWKFEKIMWDVDSLSNIDVFKDMKFLRFFDRDPIDKNKKQEKEKLN